MTGDPAMAVRDAGSEAGFTLVELLVALALFSLLATLLFDNVRLGLHAWKHGSAHAEHFEHSMVSQDLMRRMIGNIYPMLVTDGGTQPRIDFDGARDAIGFLGNAPIVASGGGRFRYRFFVERQRERSDLVLSSTPELADPQGMSMTTRTLLLSDIDRAEFSYFGEAGAERSVQWHDSWTQRSDMPKLVRVRVAFRSGDARLWPELLIAPRIAADVSCIYDPLTMRCRGR
jgi:general secretion pathway protein J